MEIKKILWPTDLSENASLALPMVTSLAEIYQSEVHVLYVLEAMGHFGSWYGDFDFSEFEKLQIIEKEKAESELDDICTGHLQGCPLYIRHTAQGDPANEILKFVEPGDDTTIEEYQDGELLEVYKKINSLVFDVTSELKGILNEMVETEEGFKEHLEEWMRKKWTKENK